jgi:hypothetical protein
MTTVVVDADVLGRRRTGDETHVLNLLHELDPLAREALALLDAAPLSLAALQAKLAARHAPAAVAEAVEELVACDVLRDARAPSATPAARSRRTSGAAPPPATRAAGRSRARCNS